MGFSSTPQRVLRARAALLTVLKDTESWQALSPASGPPLDSLRQERCVLARGRLTSRPCLPPLTLRPQALGALSAEGAGWAEGGGVGHWESAPEWQPYSAVGSAGPEFTSQLTTYPPGTPDKSQKRPHFRLPLCKMDTVKECPPHGKGWFPVIILWLSST